MLWFDGTFHPSPFKQVTRGSVTAQVPHYPQDRAKCVCFEILTRNHMIHLPAITMGVTEVHTAHGPSIALFLNNNVRKTQNFQVIYNLPDYFHKWLFFFFWLNTLFHFWLLTKRQDIVAEFVALQFYIEQHLSVSSRFLFQSLTLSCKMSSLVTQKNSQIGGKKHGFAASEWFDFFCWNIRKGKMGIFTWREHVNFFMLK